MLALTPSGDLLIHLSRTPLHIRKIVLSTGQVTTVAYNGDQMASYIRVLSDQEYLLIDNRLIRYNAATRAATTLAGGGAVSISEGVFAPNAGGGFQDALQRRAGGELVVSHSNVFEPVWRVDTQNLFRPLVVNRNPVYAGSSSAQTRLFNPVSILGLHEGVALSSSNALVRLPTGGAASSLLTPPFIWAIPMLESNDGQTFYYMSGNEVYRFTPGTPATSVAAGTLLGLTAITVAPSGQLFAIEGNQFLLRWVGTFWERLAQLPLNHIRGPMRMTADGALIYGVGMNGLIRFRPENGGAYDIIEPFDTLAYDLDAQGNVYTATLENGVYYIYRYDKNTGMRTMLAGGADRVESGPAAGAYVEPQSLAVDRTSGDLYLLETTTPQIRRITGASTYAPSASLSVLPAGDQVLTFTGGELDLTVTTQTPGMAWTVSSDQSWLVATPVGPAAGNGTVRLTISPNSSGFRRAAKVRIGDVLVRVYQEGYLCSYSMPLASTTVSAGPSAQTGTFEVRTQAGCLWNPASTVPWMRVEQPILRTGTGRVDFTVAVQTGAAARAGYIRVTSADSHTVFQAGTTPNAQLPGLGFTPVAPCRVLDTRLPSGRAGGPSLTAGVPRTISLAGVCNISPEAKAVSLNITVVPKGSLGYITVWQSGQARPTTSTLNSLDGRIKANAAILGVNPDNGQSIDLFANGDTDVIVDVNGFFSPAGNLVFYSLIPCRLADTRLGFDHTGLGGPSLVAGASRTFALAKGSCGVPRASWAHALNATVVPPGPLGYLTLAPADTALPLASTLNAPTGTIVANMAIVPGNYEGSIAAFANGTTDLILDSTGYFAPPGLPGGLRYVPMASCRVEDTRVTRPGQPLQPGATNLFRLDTNPACNVPAGAKAVAINATVLPENNQPVGYLTLWAAASSRPLASTLNATEGQFTSNSAIVPVSQGIPGIAAFMNGTAHLLIDLSGYFIAVP